MPMALTERDARAIAQGYGPEAERVVCIDFDGVLYPFGLLMDDPAPIPGAVVAMQRLKAAGYRIVILTSRLSPLWLARSGHDLDEQRAHVIRLLDRDGIPFDSVTYEKVPAEFYVDDRAIRFDGNWPAVTDFILWSRGVTP